MRIGAREYDKDYFDKRIGNIYQLGGTRHYELMEGSTRGTRMIDVITGSGFNFTLTPDRGLDISLASFKGVNLVYQTPNGEVNPAFFQPHGMEWLRTFFAGLLTTCGLTYFGPPGMDKGVELGLHGRYSTIPAKRVCDLSRWEGSEYVIEITGTVEDSVLFAEKLRMTRTIRSRIGQKFLTVYDTVENYGSKPSPLTILYHVNAGFPLLDKGTELVISSRHIEPYDEFSNNRIGSFNKFSDPVANAEEENFIHTMTADDEGNAYAAVINRELLGGIGLYLKFKVGSLPYLSEWKMMDEIDYVFGIEPCNTRCENREVLRNKNMLPFLQPKETNVTELEIGVLEGKEEIKDFENKVHSIV
jgi:hypothetical protein